MDTTGVGRLIRAVVEVAEGPVDDADPSAYLALLARHAAACAGGAAVGLLAGVTDGRAEVVAGSDARARTLELRQVQAAGGPAHDALHTGQPAVGVVLAGAVDRWPAFTPYALEAGFAVVHTVLLQREDVVLGALDVLAEPGQDVDRTQLEVVQGLADLAAVTLLRHRALRRAERLAAQLQEALTSRIPIEQAKGSLAQARGLDPEAAFDLLRSYARAHHRNLAEVAAGWLAHPERFPDLRTDCDPPREGPSGFRGEPHHP